MSIDGKKLPSVVAGDVQSIDIDMLSSVDIDMLSSVDIDMLSSVDFMIVYLDLFFLIT